MQNQKVKATFVACWIGVSQFIGAGCSSSSSDGEDPAEQGALPNCEGNPNPWELAGNDCQYSVTRASGTEVANGTCNITTLAMSSPLAASLLFQGGTANDAMPYDRFNMTMVVEQVEWPDLEGFQYELGQEESRSFHLGADYLSGAQQYAGSTAAQITSDPDLISVSCDVTLTPEVDSIDANEHTFEVDSVEPVCMVDSATYYTIHGSLITRCEGNFGALSDLETLVREDVTISVTF